MCLGIRVVVRPKPRKIGRRTLFAEVLEASRPSTAFQVRGATRGQGRTHGDQRTWWRGLRIAERRKTSTFRLLLQVTGFPVIRSCAHEGRGRRLRSTTDCRPCEVPASPAYVLKRVVTFWQAGRAQPALHAHQ